jgi:hypothetical protein
MIPDMEQMRDLLETTGVAEDNLRLINETDGAHSEWFWAREYPDAYDWLFEGTVLGATPINQKKTNVYPNPVRNEFHIAGGPDSGLYQLVNVHGQVVAAGNYSGSRINISAVPAGLYHVKVRAPTGEAAFSKLIKI